ncbi:MAG: AAA family ATPase, partial [Armatimonadetes bacterium]|nr:AAA family ATPase [Armatimonadota bacterium]
MAEVAREIPFSELDYRYDPGAWSFETTADLDTGDPRALQPRAAAALDFGLDVDFPGYHLFLAGPPGTGRRTFLERELRRRAADKPVPEDWCYLHNFADPDRPVATHLSAGRGEELRRDMERCVSECRAEMRRALESEPYQERRRELSHQAERQHEALLAELQAHARERGFLLQPVPMGMASVPLNPQGEAYTEEEFSQLPEETRHEIERRGEELQARVEQTVNRLRRLERETNERLEELDREVARWAVSHPLDELHERYRDTPRVGEYLDGLANDMVENRQLLIAPEQAVRDPHIHAAYETLLARYRVNVFVSHARDGGAPVIFEQHPTYYNLVGRSEYRAQMSGLVTDVGLIKPGALQRANGGYLVLDILDVLIQPFAWDALKRSLITREARLENIAEQFALLPVSTLKPEPIPLRLKVVLIGQPLWYYLLYALDEDFRKLFKVKADFDTEVRRTPEFENALADIIAHSGRQEQLLPLDRGALARVLDFALRLRQDRRRLSTLLEPITDVVREAAAWARSAGESVIRAEHVQQAISEREYRANLLEEKILDRLAEGTLMVSVTGATVGQVNGLSVLDLGDYIFGRPMRITARTAFGRGGVVDIERESELGGRIHSKGVMILAGYLAGQYGGRSPLPLAASLCFEQSYEEVEGDSASSAELYALLSSLADVPICQDIAVTGSVNQHGEIQPVGGVTQKVEAFFKTCQRKGLTGSQGVLIPHLNLPNLVLRGEVLEAIRAGQFHIWAARTLDEGIALLTGLPAGERGPDGRFPPDTVHGRVQARLEEYVRQLKELGVTPETSTAGNDRRRARIVTPSG